MVDKARRGISSAPRARASNSASVKNAVAELAKINAQIEAARLTLSQLQQTPASAEPPLADDQAVQLRQANERLVVTAVLAQTNAELATQALTQLALTAELDPLTQLPNRALLLDRFAHAIATAKRHHTRLAVLFIDIDDFKQVNDTLGHTTGDAVLKIVAQCLTAAVRDADTVSRYGGDEFLILLTDVGAMSDVVMVVTRLIATLGGPQRIGDRTFRVKASIGISIYPDDGDEIAALIERADAAMYDAKRQGLGRFVFHSEEVPNELTRDTLPPEPM
jgi:diguanylate cyclase